MAIALACPTCAHSVPVTADMAGRRARCPKCRMDLALPSALIDLPDRDASESEPAATRRARASVLPWVLGIGAGVAMLALLCGTPFAIVWYVLRQNREAAELAQRTTVAPPGANLPAGAPPRAMRVSGFVGVFEKQDQLVQADVVFVPMGGGANNNNRVCKEYVIDLEAGKTYIINLDRHTPQFDPYLRLADLKGQVIAENDDSGGDLNSQIVFTASETKSYLIVATSLGGGFGGFTLTVREARFARPR